jgi:hypothetical protein
MWQRHATDVTSLVSGTVFAGATAIWLLNVTDVIDLEEAWVGGPVVLIVAGVVGLIATLRPSRHTTPARGHDSVTDWVGAPMRPDESAAGTDAAPSVPRSESTGPAQGPNEGETRRMD